MHRCRALGWEPQSLDTSMGAGSADSRTCRLPSRRGNSPRHTRNSWPCQGGNRHRQRRDSTSGHRDSFERAPPVAAALVGTALALGKIAAAEVDVFGVHFMLFAAHKLQSHHFLSEHASPRRTGRTRFFVSHLKGGSCDLETIVNSESAGRQNVAILEVARETVKRTRQKATMRLHVALIACLLSAAIGAFAAPSSRPGAPGRPPWAEKARMARWLVHESNYTVLASTSSHLHGAPFPNVLATSDGSGWGDCTGKVSFLE